MPTLEVVALGWALWAASKALSLSDETCGRERSHDGQRGGLVLWRLSPGRAPPLSGAGHLADAHSSGGLRRVLTQLPLSARPLYLSAFLTAPLTSLSVFQGLHGLCQSLAGHDHIVAVFSPEASQQPSRAVSTLRSPGGGTSHRV